MGVIKMDKSKAIMRNQPEVSVSYQLIAQAAELLLKCADYLDDSDAALKKGMDHVKTYYAIDTDVIVLYLEPELMANYLDVFGEGRDSTTTRSLAFLLGEFLIESAEPLIPGQQQQCRFLIIPPHDEEILRMLSAIHRDLNKVHTRLGTPTFEKLTEVFNRFDQKQDTKRLIDDLRKCVPDLVELFNPYRGPKAALTRYAQLSDNTFRRIDTYSENKFTFPLLDPINNGMDRKQANKLMNEWVARLRKRKIPNKPEYALQNDAEVLSTLEYVNSSLRDAGKKVVLVTGSNYLFEAGDSYCPWNEKLTFSDMYLRHPQAFLAHPKFFSMPPDSNSASSSREQKIPFKLIDWLNLFFPSALRRAIQPQGVVQRDLLRKIRDHKGPSFGNILESLFRRDKDTQPKGQLLEEWKTQVASAAEARYANGLDRAEERGATELAETLKGLRDKGAWSVKSLRALVFKESLGSISKLYSTSVWIGLWIKWPREQSKGIPALRFDDRYIPAGKYCHDVIKLQMESIKKEVTTSKLEKLRKLNDKVIKLDPTLYHAHLVHALAFATKGHWYATLTLTNIAIAISDALDQDKRGYIQGREAAYLACIAARRSVINREGLSKAVKYLDEARDRENEGWPEDIRFEAERLAIITRHYYFDYFCEPRKQFDIQSIEDTLDSLQRVIETSKKEKNRWVKRWVLRQTLTNYFTLLLMVRADQGSDGIANVESVKKNIKGFQKVLMARQPFSLKPDDDPHAHLVCNICTAIWDSDSQRREKAKKAALDTINKSWKAYMPYDEERLNLLKRSIPANSPQK